MSNVRYSLSEKWRISDTPGIGSYSIDRSSIRNRPSTPSYSIPRSTSASLFSALLSSSTGPGPNAYETSKSFTQTRRLAPRTRIGSATRDGKSIVKGKDQEDTLPGPANYELQNLDSCTGNRPITRPRSATLRFPQASRQTSLVGTGTFSTNYNAAPGSYDISEPFIKTRPTTPQTSIGKSLRSIQTSSSTQTPAPNAYNTMDASLTRLSGKILGPRIRIGSAKRPTFGNENGTYGSSSNTTLTTSTPGPNAYMVDLGTSLIKPSAPRTSIGKSSRENISNINSLTRTGPADYDTIKYIQSLSSRKTAARAVIGTASRNSGGGGSGGGGSWLGKVDISPGPNAYVGVKRLESVLRATHTSSPAYTMRAR